MKKKILLMLFTLLSVSCKNKQPDESNIVVSDLLNREVTLDTDCYKKVVCIGAGALRLYSYVGDVNNLVGVEDIDRNVDANIFEDVARPYYDLNKDYFKTLPSCGRGGPQAQTAEVEKILSCNPTLIISEYGDVTKANNLQNQTKIPVVVVSYGNESVFDNNIRKSISLLGQILHESVKASKLIGYIDGSKTELMNFAIDVDEENKPSMYIGCLGNWGKQDIFSTSSNFPLFNVSKIKNIVDSSIPLNNGNLEKEAFFKLNPDIIVLDSAGINIFKKSYNENKNLFNSLKAISTNNIYLEMPFNAYYTNLEIALMDSYFLASISYPEKFSNINLEDKYDEISKAFLGKECYDIIKEKKYSYGGFQKISDLEGFLNNA